MSTPQGKNHAHTNEGRACITVHRILWTTINLAICTITFLAINVQESKKDLCSVHLHERPAPTPSPENVSLSVEHVDDVAATTVGNRSTANPETLDAHPEDVQQEDAEKYLSHLAPEIPLKRRDDHFLVVLGVLTMDTPDGHKRRNVHRSSWMKYSGIWTAQSTKSPLASALASFVTSKNPRHGNKFSDTLIDEATKHEDIVALDFVEGRSTGKNDSTTYGTWGLEAHVKGICLKSFLWRRIAVAAFKADFIAKADDDVFIVVPQFIATLESLPRRRLYWGLASHCRRNPFDSSTKFPYIYGMLATTSFDLASGIASSTHLEKLVQPFSGRPAEYVLGQLDREDLMIGGAINRLGLSDVHIYTDCRIIEPSYVSFGEVVNLKNYQPYKLDYAVALHKLPISQFQSTMKNTYPEMDAPYKSPEFTEHHPYNVPRYHWHKLPEKICKSRFLDNCKMYTGWPELGPMDWKLPKTTKSIGLFVATKNAYQNLTLIPGVLAMIGMMSYDTPQDALYREEIRKKCFFDSHIWSPMAPKNPIALRFVIGKHQRNEYVISRELMAESATNGDVVVLVRKEGGTRNPKFDITKMLQWLNAATKITQAPFIGVLRSTPGFSFSVLATVLKSLPRSRVQMGYGGYMVSAKNAFPFVRQGLLIVSRDVAIKVAPDQLRGIQSYRFNTASTFAMVGRAVDKELNHHVNFYHDCRFSGNLTENTCQLASAENRDSNEVVAQFKEYTSSSESIGSVWTVVGQGCKMNQVPFGRD